MMCAGIRRLGGVAFIGLTTIGYAKSIENWDLYKDHWERLDYRYTRTHDIDRMPKERSKPVAKNFTHYEGAQYEARLKQEEYARKYDTFGPDNRSTAVPPNYRWAQKQKKDPFRYDQYDGDQRLMRPPSNVYIEKKIAVRKPEKNIFNRLFGAKDRPEAAEVSPIIQNSRSKWWTPKGMWQRTQFWTANQRKLAEIKLSEEAEVVARPRELAGPEPKKPTEAWMNLFDNPKVREKFEKSERRKPVWK